MPAVMGESGLEPTSYGCRNRWSQLWLTTLRFPFLTYARRSTATRKELPRDSLAPWPECLVESRPSLMNTLICLFVLFFFFRDGRGMVRRIYVLLPLRIDQAKRLVVRVKETLRAIVWGTLAIAILQGTLAGLAGFMGRGS